MVYIYRYTCRLNIAINTYELFYVHVFIFPKLYLFFFVIQIFWFMCTIVDIVYLALVDIQRNLFVPLLPTNLKSSGTLLCNVVLHQFRVVDIFSKGSAKVYISINRSVHRRPMDHWCVNAMVHNFEWFEPVIEFRYNPQNHFFPFYFRKKKKMFQLNIIFER